MKTGFFEEAEGVKSSTRLNSFIMMFFTIGFDYLWVFKVHKIDDSFIILNLLFLLAIFAPKYLHKIAEIKIK